MVVYCGAPKRLQNHLLLNAFFVFFLWSPICKGCFKKNEGLVPVFLDASLRVDIVKQKTKIERLVFESQKAGGPLKKLWTG